MYKINHIILSRFPIPFIEDTVYWFKVNPNNLAFVDNGTETIHILSTSGGDTFLLKSPESFLKGIYPEDSIVFYFSAKDNKIIPILNATTAEIISEEYVDKIITSDEIYTIANIGYCTERRNLCVAYSAYTIYKFCMKEISRKLLCTKIFTHVFPRLFISYLIESPDKEFIKPEKFVPVITEENSSILRRELNAGKFPHLHEKRLKLISATDLKNSNYDPKFIGRKVYLDKNVPLSIKSLSFERVGEINIVVQNATKEELEFFGHNIVLNIFERSQL